VEPRRTKINSSNNAFSAATCSLMLFFCQSSLAATWIDIKTKALNAPAIRSAQGEVEAANAGLESSKAGFYPRLYSTLQATRTRDEQYKTSGNNYSAAINLEQSLFASGRDLANFDAAESSRKASLLSLKDASVTLRSSLAKAWSRALYFDRLGVLTKQTISRRESNSQIVRLRYASGRESKGSLLVTENAEQRALVDFHDAQKKSLLSRADLGVLTASPLSVKEPLLGSLADDSWAPPAEHRQQDLKVAANEAKLEAARASIQAARAKYFPDLSLTASARKSAQSGLSLKEPIFAAGLSVTIPIFDGRNSGDVRAATAKMSILEATLTRSKLESDQATQTALANFEIARERLTVTRQGLEAAKVQAEVSRQRYTLGLMSFQDWDSFESALIKSELEVLSSEKDLADAVSDYLSAIGTTLEDDP
jgi:outer membrane protein TolC